jgi:uncharacterized protein (TIGR03435 family)
MKSTGALLVFILGCQSLAAQGAAAFDVASIRLSQPDKQKFAAETLPGGRFAGHNVTTRFLVNVAYGPKQVTIIGAPDWFDELYDINARVDGADEMTKWGFRRS